MDSAAREAVGPERAALAQRRADLALPAARAERQASADALTDQSAGEAKETLQDAFGALAGAPAFAVEDLVKDGEITKFVDDHSAQVRLDNGKNGVLVSPLPLQVPANGGGKDSVDAALTSDGQDFVPAAPLADYSVAKDLDQGIDLEAADVTITPQGPGVANAEPQRVGGSVLWANTSADTDFVVSPTPTGVETFHQVRSQEAPESFALDVTVPEGGEIKRSEKLPAALEITGADGKTVATVSPAIAQDADGTDVPASYAIDNNLHRITINVPHRNRDVHYPILVDPVMDMEQILWDANAHGNYPGWRPVASPYLLHMAGHGLWGDGLYLWMVPGNGYDYLDTNAWTFKAPGDSSIAGAVETTTYYAAAGQSCIALGMLAGDGGGGVAWQAGTSELHGGGITGNPYVNCGSSYADQSRTLWGSTTPPGNFVAMQFVSLGGTSPYFDAAYLKYSHVYILDDKLPATGTSDLSNVNPDSTMTFVAADSGTGVQRVAVYATDFPGWNQAYDTGYDCKIQYAPDWGCPQYIPRNLSVGNLPNGPRTIHMKVWDASGNFKETDYTANVNNPYPKSWQYGGADHSINTPGEATDALIAFQNGPNQNPWTEVSPTDNAYLTTRLIGAFAPAAEEATTPPLPDESGAGQITGGNDDPNDPGTAIGDGDASAAGGTSPNKYCKPSKIPRMSVAIPDGVLPAELGYVLQFGDMGHVDNEIYWCHGSWTIGQVAPDFTSGVKGIANRRIFYPDGMSDAVGYFYHYNGHGETSGYSYMRRAYFRCKDPSGNIDCPFRWYIRQRVYLHGDGTKHISPMYTNMEW